MELSTYTALLAPWSDVGTADWSAIDTAVSDLLADGVVERDRCAVAELLMDRVTGYDAYQRTLGAMPTNAETMAARIVQYTQSRGLSCFAPCDTGCSPTMPLQKSWGTRYCVCPARPRVRRL